MLDPGKSHLGSKMTSKEKKKNYEHEQGGLLISFSRIFQPPGTL